MCCVYLVLQTAPAITSCYHDYSTVHHHPVGQALIQDLLYKNLVNFVTICHDMAPIKSIVTTRLLLLIPLHPTRASLEPPASPPLDISTKLRHLMRFVPTDHSLRE